MLGSGVAVILWSSEGIGDKREVETIGIESVVFWVSKMLKLCIGASTKDTRAGREAFGVEDLGVVSVEATGMGRARLGV